MKKSLLQNQGLPPRGFTLVEMMVILGVSTLLVAGLAGSFNFAWRSMRSVDQNQKYQGLVEDLRLALRTKENCTRNLKDRVLDPAQPGIPVTTVNLYDAAGNVQTEIIAPKKDYEGVTVQQVQLIPRASIAKNQVAAELEIQAHKVITSDGPGLQAKSFAVLVEIDPLTKKIISCSSSMDEGVPLMDRICEVMSGGQQFYDPEKGICVSRYNTTCTPGTRAAATCPAGTKLSSCKVGRPGGFDDDFDEVINRGYLGPDGESRLRIIRAPPGFGEMNASTNSCTCFYGVGVTGAFECRACCDTLAVPF